MASRQKFHVYGAEFHGNYEYIELTDEANKLIKKQCMQAFRSVGRSVANDVRSQVHKKTGALRKGVKAKVECNRENGYTPKLLVGYKKQSAMTGVDFYINPSWYEEGTAPHVIKPKNGTHLKIGNFFTTGVQHNGSVAWHTLSEIAHRDQSKIVNSIKANLAKIDGVTLIEGDTQIETEENEL